MKINIDIFSGRINHKITANTLTGDFFADGKRKSSNINNFIERLLGIVILWKENMVGPELLDGESYNVTITDENNETVCFNGKNAFPDNYSDFVSLIKEVIQND